MVFVVLSREIILYGQQFKNNWLVCLWCINIIKIPFEWMFVSGWEGKRGREEFGCFLSFFPFYCGFGARFGGV